jgi:hypothetical protein
MNETVPNLPKKGMSTGAKWGLGCGIGCLTLILIAAIAGFAGYRFIMGKVDAMTRELQQQGFAKVVKGQALVIKDEITEPTLYIGQAVKILGDCKTNLAIIAQVGEIHGRVDGKAYFRGQVLTIQPKAELCNGLDVMAQVIQKYGKIVGGIMGTYQTVSDQATGP